jgi:hypothetical protein
MKKHILVATALAAALLAGGAQATTVNFGFSLEGINKSTGSFSFADGKTGVIGYTDLSAFSLLVEGVTYSLSDVLPLTDYVHFAYDIGANVFKVDNNSVGWGDNDPFSSVLSATNSTGSFGFFFSDPFSIPPGQVASIQEFSQLPLYGVGNNFDAISMIVLRGEGGVPEPATWALMLVGFGALGAVVRNRRRNSAAACA